MRTDTARRVVYFDSHQHVTNVAEACQRKRTINTAGHPRLRPGTVRHIPPQQWIMNVITVFSVSSNVGRCLVRIQNQLLANNITRVRLFGLKLTGGCWCERFGCRLVDSNCHPTGRAGFRHHVGAPARRAGVEAPREKALEKKMTTAKRLAVRKRPIVLDRIRDFH